MNNVSTPGLSDDTANHNGSLPDNSDNLINGRMEDVETTFDDLSGSCSEISAEMLAKLRCLPDSNNCLSDLPKHQPKVIRSELKKLKRESSSKILRLLKTLTKKFKYSLLEEFANTESQEDNFSYTNPLDDLQYFLSETQERALEWLIEDKNCEFVKLGSLYRLLRDHRSTKLLNYLDYFYAYTRARKFQVKHTSLAALSKKLRKVRDKTLEEYQKSYDSWKPGRLRKLRILNHCNLPYSVLDMFTELTEQFLEDLLLEDDQIQSEVVKNVWYTEPSLNLNSQSCKTQSHELWNRLESTFSQCYLTMANDPLSNIYDNVTKSATLKTFMSDATHSKATVPVDNLFNQPPYSVQSSSSTMTPPHLTTYAGLFPLDHESIEQMFHICDNVLECSGSTLYDHFSFMTGDQSFKQNEPTCHTEEEPVDRGGQLETPPPPVSNDEFISEELPVVEQSEKYQEEPIPNHEEIPVLEAVDNNDTAAAILESEIDNSILPPSITLETQCSVDLDEASSVESIEEEVEEEDLSELELGDFQVVEEWEMEKSSFVEPEPPYLAENFQLGDVVDLTEKSIIEEEDKEEDSHCEDEELPASPCRNIFDIFSSPTETHSESQLLEAPLESSSTSPAEEETAPESESKHEEEAILAVPGTTIDAKQKSSPVEATPETEIDVSEPSASSATVCLGDDDSNIFLITTTRKRQLESEEINQPEQDDSVVDLKKRKRESLKKKLEEVNQEIARINRHSVTGNQIYPNPSSVQSMPSVQLIASPPSKAASSPARRPVSKSPSSVSSLTEEDCVVVDEAPLTSPAPLIAGLIFTSQQTCSAALNDIIDLYYKWESDMARQGLNSANQITSRSVSVTFKRDLDQLVDAWKKEETRALNLTSEKDCGRKFTKLEPACCDKVGKVASQFMRNVHNSFKLLIPDNDRPHKSRKPRELFLSLCDLLREKDDAERSDTPGSDISFNLGNLPQFSSCAQHLYDKLVGDAPKLQLNDTNQPKYSPPSRRPTGSITTKSSAMKEPLRRSKSRHDRSSNERRRRTASSVSRDNHSSKRSHQYETWRRSSSTHPDRKRDDRCTSVTQSAGSQVPSLEKPIDSIESIDEIILSDPYVTTCETNDRMDTAAAESPTKTEQKCQNESELPSPNSTMPVNTQQPLCQDVAKPSEPQSTKRALSPRSSRIRGMLLSYKRDVTKKCITKPLNDPQQQAVLELIDEIESSKSSDRCGKSKINNQVTIEKNTNTNFQPLPSLVNSPQLLGSVPLPGAPPVTTTPAVQLPPILTSLLASSQNQSIPRPVPPPSFTVTTAISGNQTWKSKSSPSSNPLHLPFPPTCDIPLPAPIPPTNPLPKFNSNEGIAPDSNAAAQSKVGERSSTDSAPSAIYGVPPPEVKLSETSCRPLGGESEIQIPGILDGYLHESSPSPSPEKMDESSSTTSNSNILPSNLIGRHKTDIDERVHLPAITNTCAEKSAGRSSHSPVGQWHKKRVLILNHSHDPIANKVKTFIESEGGLSFDAKHIPLCGRDLNVLVHGDWFSFMRKSLPHKEEEPTEETTTAIAPNYVNLLQWKQFSCIHIYGYQTLEDVVQRNFEVLFPHGRSCLVPDHEVLIKTHPDTLQMLLEFMEQEKNVGRVWNIKISHQAMNQIKLYILRCPSSEVGRMDSLIGLLNDNRWSDVLEMLPVSNSSSEPIVPSLEDSLQTVIRLQKQLQRDYRHFCLFTASTPPESLLFEYSRYGISVMSLDQFVSTKTRKSVTKVLPTPESMPSTRNMSARYSDSQLSWCQESINVPNAYLASTFK